GADLDRAAAVSGIDLTQVFRGDGIDQSTAKRIEGDAAAEAADRARQLLPHAHAHEGDVGQEAPLAAAIPLLDTHAGQQPTFLRLDLYLAADLAGESDRRVFIGHAFAETLQVERDLRAGAGNFQHYADRLMSVVRAGAGDGRRGDRRRAGFFSRIEGEVP